MKYTLLALGAACTLTGCAGVGVTHTDVATGATNPKAIYVRSYIAEDAKFKGRHGGGEGNRDIRRSLAPAEFSKALKQELEKMAPAMVIHDNDSPEIGWLVESQIDYVHAGSPTARSVPVAGTPGGWGQSRVIIHVRVTDVNGTYVSNDKDSGKGGNGRVLYEFDIDGGSGITGAIGSIYAPGLGYSAPFDYKNAAERVLYALSVDPHKYGGRTSTTIRY
ncbi:MAG TPA: hypothetical protein VK968_00140 [Roseimicrobium sp.]|nr:hypothetical protein [Roseimicrobium sp.]